MPDPQLILFDDRAARDWMPFALTRPIGELRFGALTLRERAERVFGLECVGHISAAHLLGYDEPGAPPVLDPGSLRADRDTLFLSSRAVPAWGEVGFSPGVRPALVRIGETVAGWYAPAGSALPDSEFFLDPAAAAREALAGTAGVDEIVRAGSVVDRIWQLVTRNAEQLTRDILALFPEPARPELGPGVHVLGEGQLIVDRSASVEPGVVIDLRHGPVWIDAGARIAPFTYLVGPVYVGRNTTILGGPIAESTIGPTCRIHGEVEASVVLGYSNKAHDGFLGHAYVGCWVNLGALTTNSDLKNNYGSVRIWTPRGEADTGERKLGCLLGDHVKTAIGTLLNTGTVVGAGSNLFGTGSPPRYVPPFTWGIGPAAGEYDLEKFLATAEIVMSRRNVTLSPKQRTMLESAWLLGRGRT